MYNVEGQAEKVEEKVTGAGAKLCKTLQELAEKTEVIISAVPANFSVSVTEEVSSCLKPGTLFIDVTTASPSEKQQMAQMINNAESLFVDAAMMGSLPKEKHQVPMLISGDGTEKMMAFFQDCHMDLTSINEVPGAATSIKYVRSIITKGLACLLIEALQLSGKYNVEKIVMDSISESLDKIPFNDTIDRYVSGTITHCVRRKHEIDNVIQAQTESNIPSTMTKAVSEKLGWIDSCHILEQFDAGLPSNWKEIAEKWQLKENS